MSNICERLSIMRFSFIVSTSVDGGPFEPLVTLPAGSTSYTDLDVLPETDYAYRLVAINLAAEAQRLNPHPPGVFAACGLTR